MGRGKIEIKRIEDRQSRQVTFSKRRQGFLKKAKELGILCDAQVGVVIFSSSGKMTEYSSPPFSIPQLIERYQMVTNTCFNDLDSNQQLFGEVTRLRDEIEKMQAGIKQFTGEDLTSLSGDDLSQLEGQLEFSLDKIRTRKHQLIHQQLDNLRRKEHMLEDQNTNLFRALSEQRATVEAQQAVAQSKSEISMFGHFEQLYTDNQAGPSEPRNLLELSPQLHTFRLQPIQPNLQDTSLNDTGLQLW